MADRRPGRRLSDDPPTAIVYVNMPPTVGRLTYEAVDRLLDHHAVRPAAENTIVARHGMTLGVRHLTDGRVVGKGNRYARLVTYAILAADAEGLLDGRALLELDYFARRSRRCREVAVIDENGARLTPEAIARLLDAFDLDALPGTDDEWSD